MKKWAVIHLIHVHTPRRHIPKLFIEDVPDEVTKEELRSVLTRSGYIFGEFGVLWANHYLAPHDQWEDEVVGAYHRGVVERVKWDELLRRSQII